MNTTTTTTREHEPISVRVIEAIADAERTDPLELEPPLYYSIDTEALDRLFRTEIPGLIVFEYGDHEVVVRNDGTVTVDGTVYESQ